MGRKRACELVVDTTAGLGRDALILASSGLSVILLERSPTIFRLLQDAHSRASLSDQLHLIAARMTLNNIDSSEWLKMESSIEIIRKHDTTIYCDPMFPQQRKQAKVKREMQLFQHLFSDSRSADPDGATARDNSAVMKSCSTDKLIERALESGAKKVVVKRPLKSRPLFEAPSYILKGRSVRFDIYIR